MGNPSHSTRFQNGTIFAYLLLYKTVIECIYIFYISPKYGYDGLTLNINSMGYTISTLYLLAIVMFSPKDRSRPSTYIIFLIELIVFTPTLSYYWLNSQNHIYVQYVVISAIMISIILRIKITNLRLIPTSEKKWLSIIYYLYIVLTVLLIVRRGGIDSRALSLSSIYALRSENNITGIFGYLLNWSAKAFFPFYFVYFLFMKRIREIFVITALQFMLYFSFGNKAFLFSVAFIVMCVALSKRRNFEKTVPLGFTALNLIAFFLSKVNITDFLSISIPYRMVFIPAQIQFRYYDFFSITDKMHFAESFIGKLLLIKSPYTEGVSYMISAYYSSTGRFGNANTGFLADAYSNGGLIAMLVIAIVLALLLCIIDASTKSLPIYVVLGSLSYTMFVLNDTALLVSLLTGGMGLIIGLLSIFNNYVELRESNRSTKNI